MVTYQVDACNVHIDIIGYLQTVHLPEKMRAGINNIDRNNPILYNKLVIINILQKKIKCIQPLFDTFFHKGPFVRSNDTRNNIKREYLLYAFTAAVNRKGNTLAHEQPFGKLFFS